MTDTFNCAFVADATLEDKLSGFDTTQLATAMANDLEPLYWLDEAKDDFYGIRNEASLEKLRQLGINAVATDKVIHGHKVATVA